MTWIPVEEALPKSQNEYLVTVNFDGDTYVECLHYGKPLMANREVKGECFYDSDDEWGDVVYDTGTEVIAWMPLPEPYKADRKTVPQTEKFPQKWTDWCKECGKKERCVRAGFMPQCYESEDEPQTCSFSDCDNFKNPDYERCIECKRKQIKLKTEQTERSE